MYSRITKSTINIELIKRINTDNTPFYAILYLLESRNKIIVENPSQGICREVSAGSIGNYIRLNKVKTDWFPNIDGSYLKVIDNMIHHILPISRELQLVNIRFKYHISKLLDFKRIRPVSEKNFKLTKTNRFRHSEFENEHIIINAFLPVWPIWVKVTRNLKEHLSGYTLKTIYMKCGDIFYRFPYGNVSGSDTVCTGAQNNGMFKSAEDVWVNWFTTMFNRDYTLNLKANNFHFKIRATDTKDIAIEPTFDLNEISLKIHTRKYKNLSLIDTIYYLSNIKDFDNLEMEKLFIKLPDDPWKIKK